jgi:hypothetical protein
MFTKQILALAAVALAASSAMAQGVSDNSAPLTRAQVRQSVIAARDAGQLLPAGNSAEYPQASVATGSTVSRAAVRAATLRARANGELRDAGEHGDEPYDTAAAASSDLTRAQVVAQVLSASKAGQLIPAGDNIGERVMS